MAGKRCHYDAKGNLRGYSSDKYQPGLKDVVLIVALLLVFGHRKSNESPKPQEVTQESTRASAKVSRYVVTGTANVRSSPKTTNSDVVGKLAIGDLVSGVPAGERSSEWVEIIEGSLSGNFVWLGNLEDAMKAKATDRDSKSLREKSVVSEAQEAPAPVVSKPMSTQEYLRKTYLNGRSECITLDTVPFFEKSCREGDQAACAVLQCGS